MLADGTFLCGEVILNQGLCKPQCYAQSREALLVISLQSPIYSINYCSSLGPHSGFSGLGAATISAILQIFGILSWRMQEVRKSQNQDLRVDPAWGKNSGKMESSPGDFPGFRRQTAATSSSGLKGSEILWSSCVGIFHKSDSSLLTSLVDSQPPVPFAPFFTSCEAMEYAEMGHWRKQCPDLPVRLLMFLHSLRLECEKSMEITASSHRSCFFCPSRDRSDEAAPSESVPSVPRVKER